MNLAAERARLAQVTAQLQARAGQLPPLGIIAGTGLSGLSADLAVAGKVSYAEIGFPVSTVSSHAGELVWGELAGQAVFILRGRFHLYEGYQPQEIALPLRALKNAGMRGLIITNAAGGLQTAWRAGEIMLLEDHLNLTGGNPLIGPHAPEWGERFVDMSRVWDLAGREQACKLAGELKIKLRRGVYAALSGPSLETPAETRFLKNNGADAVGMSTVPEAIVAKQGGARLLGLSAITNINDPDNMAATNLEEIVAAAERASGDLRRLLAGLCAAWPW